MRRRRPCGRVALQHGGHRMSVMRRRRRAVGMTMRRVGSVHHGKGIVASVMRGRSRARSCARSARGSRLLAGRRRGRGCWVVVVHGRMRLRLR